MQKVVESKIGLVSMHKKAWTTSTLQIPKTLLPFLKLRRKKFHSTNRYFHYLIQTYGRNLYRFNICSQTGKWKNKYQTTNLNLQTCCFVPDPHCWEEFRHIAFAYGLSMCHLFVVLMQLEQSRWIEAGCPDDFSERFPALKKLKHKKRNYVRKIQNQKPNDGLNHKKAGFSVHLHRQIDYGGSNLSRILYL